MLLGWKATALIGNGGMGSVSYGYGFPHRFHLVVYTGTNMVYQMLEPGDTVPV
jgi:ABC-type methionine transport system permease subunit